ncbi:hypothetical protein evm_001665 [Chilo suppressalis]|nr:hypothetical protein evm_001665 [Chilo suppressalis]
MVTLVTAQSSNFIHRVNVPTPDFGGRREILQLYLARVAANPGLDVDMLARGTTGFTGADLESMVNQAALKAAIDGAKTVTMKYLEDARDKVLMGPERRSRLPDEEANTITAYHEGGHAIVAYYTKDSHPLHKVTIMPRGPSLGHTAYIPAKERHCVINLPEKIFKPQTEGLKNDSSPSSADIEKKEKDDQMKPQNLTCCILMLDILLKQMELQQRRINIQNVSSEATKLLRLMLKSNQTNTIEHGMHNNHHQPINVPTAGAQ